MPDEEIITEIEAAVGELKLEEVGAIAGEVEETTTEEETQGEAVDVTKEAEEIKETDEGVEISGDESGEEAERTEEKPPVISDELLERAVGVGIPVVDARGLPIESLKRIVKGREAEFAEDIRRRERIQTDEEDPELKEVDPFADFPGLDPEVHDAATIAMFDKLKGIAKQQQGTIEGFEARQGETERATVEKDRRDTTQWFDKQVSGLGENFAETLGAGGYDSLDQGSSQYAKREAIANQITVLLAGYNAIGQEAPPRDEVFDTAARLVLHDEYQQSREKELSGDLAKRATQHIQRAGGQKATGKETPMEEAARLIDERFS